MIHAVKLLQISHTHFIASKVFFHLDILYLFCKCVFLFFCQSLYLDGLFSFVCTYLFYFMLIAFLITNQLDDGVHDGKRVFEMEQAICWCIFSFFPFIDSRPQEIIIFLLQLRYKTLIITFTFQNVEYKDESNNSADCFVLVWSVIYVTHREEYARYLKIFVPKKDGISGKLRYYVQWKVLSISDVKHLTLLSESEFIYLFMYCMLRLCMLVLWVFWHCCKAWHFLPGHHQGSEIVRRPTTSIMRLDTNWVKSDIIFVYQTLFLTTMWLQWSTFQSVAFVNYRFAVFNLDFSFLLLLDAMAKHFTVTLIIVLSSEKTEYGHHNILENTRHTIFSSCFY
jgi:hypothetical protein